MDWADWLSAYYYLPNSLKPWKLTLINKSPYMEISICLIWLIRVAMRKLLKIPMRRQSETWTIRGTYSFLWICPPFFVPNVSLIERIEFYTIAHRVHYTYFDFHQECKGLRFDRVQILIDQLHDQLIEQAYFSQDLSGASSNPPSKTQKSVVRTNCMDWWVFFWPLLFFSFYPWWVLYTQRARGKKWF